MKTEKRNWAHVLEKASAQLVGGLLKRVTIQQ
jgi:hypothetical protein